MVAQWSQHRLHYVFLVCLFDGDLIYALCVCHLKTLFYHVVDVDTRCLVIEFATVITSSSTLKVLDKLFVMLIALFLVFRGELAGASE